MSNPIEEAHLRGVFLGTAIMTAVYALLGFVVVTSALQCSGIPERLDRIEQRLAK